MKKFVLILFLYAFHINAQNLVPNWSFETYTLCPNGSSQLPSAIPWVGQTNNSVDYYNSCSPTLNVPNAVLSFQYAKDGNAFAGFWSSMVFVSANGREYPQVQLTDTLANGNCYYVEFYANLHDQIKFATNNIAANLSKIQYTTTGTGSILNLPQHITRYGNPIIKDTMNWVQIAGIYSAGGGEKYLTLGNFKDDANTDTVRSTTNNYGSYYHIDAVSVYSINPTGTLPWSYSNTSVAIGDSVYIGNTVGGTFTSNWYTYGGTFISSGAGIFVKPVTTSTYVVQFNVCGVPRSDTLTVTVTGTGINERNDNSIFTVSPNPSSGILNIKILSKEFRTENCEIEIINCLGQSVFRTKLTNEIDVSALSDGIYSLQLSTKDQIANKRLIITK